MFISSIFSCSNQSLKRDSWLGRTSCNGTRAATPWRPLTSHIPVLRSTSRDLSNIAAQDEDSLNPCDAAATVPRAFSGLPTVEERLCPNGAARSGLSARLTGQPRHRL
jgi:hypothetical protein